MSVSFEPRRPGDLVRYLDDDELRRLVASTEVAQVEPGAVILHRGAPARSIILVDEGEVEVVDEAGGTLAVFGPGEVAGEVGFVDGQARIHDVRARTRCALRRLTRDALFACEPLLVAKVLLGIAEILARRFRLVAMELAPMRAFASMAGGAQEAPAYDEIDEPLPESDAASLLRHVAGKTNRGLADV